MCFKRCPYTLSVSQSSCCCWMSCCFLQVVFALEAAGGWSSVLGFECFPEFLLLLDVLLLLASSFCSGGCWWMVFCPGVSFTSTSGKTFIPSESERNPRTEDHPPAA